MKLALIISYLALGGCLAIMSDATHKQRCPHDTTTFGQALAIVALYPVAIVAGAGDALDGTFKLPECESR